MLTLDYYAGLHNQIPFLLSRWISIHPNNQQQMKKKTLETEKNEKNQIENSFPFFFLSRL
jgi:hypothetical protein